MKKSLIFPVVFVLMLTGFFTMPVYAMDSMEMDCSQAGPDFGEHVAMMTPEHPKMHGAFFGNMVSNMAQGKPCPC